MACLELERILAPTLATRLGTEVTVAQGLINRLKREGFLKPASKPKKFVLRTLILFLSDEKIFLLHHQRQIKCI